MEQIKRMHEKGHGVIGMKIIGNGDFTKPEDREKSIRFAMQSGLLDAVIIGFKSTDRGRRGHQADQQRLGRDGVRQEVSSLKCEVGSAERGFAKS